MLEHFRKRLASASFTANMVTWQVPVNSETSKMASSRVSCRDASGSLVSGRDALAPGRVGTSGEEMLGSGESGSAPSRGASGQGISGADASNPGDSAQMGALLAG